MKKWILIAVLLLNPIVQSSSENRSADLVDAESFSASLNVDNVLAHLQALEDIARQNNGTRAAGTSGYDASAFYVAQKLLAAGYSVQFQPFEFDQFKQLAPGVFTQSSGEVYVEEKDFRVMDYSPSGQVTASVVSVDLQLGLGNKSTSGCEIEDFAGFPQGAVALIQRGTCPFVQKAENAQKAGASAAIIFNQGDEEARKDLFGGTLGANELTIPVLATGYDLGVKLAETPNVSVTIGVETEVKTTMTYNVLAETKEGDPNNIVMIGSHLDSVEDGPGVNDNGSGSASILEVALSLKDHTLPNKVRFAWWGAEEHGLIGSRYYAENLSDEEVEKIALYLNFDMVGSINYILGVYDGDGSTYNVPGPKGSAAIEKTFHEFFALKGHATVDVESDGRSDYVGFAERGIPFGGSFTGAEGEKSEEQARKFGGTAGMSYDPCYHKACDNMQNLSRDALKANLEMIGYATFRYARTTVDIEAEKAQADASLDFASQPAKTVVYPHHFHHKSVPVWAE